MNTLFFLVVGHNLIFLFNAQLVSQGTLFSIKHSNYLKITISSNREKQPLIMLLATTMLLCVLDWNVILRSPKFSQLSLILAVILQLCSTKFRFVHALNTFVQYTFSWKLRSQIRVKKFELGNNKHVWKSMPPDFTLDFCQIAQGSKHPFIKTFVPGFIERLGPMIHPCPYQVGINKHQ
jgi:hypothetical protein